MTWNSEIKKRIRSERGRKLIVSPEKAAELIKDGMTVGVSGFTPSGYPKAVPHALAQRAAKGDKFQVDLYSGASLGPEIDTEMTEAGIIRRRLPYQSDPALRKAINSGTVYYADLHISHMPQYISYGFLPRPDVAIIEAAAITEDGDLVPTTSLGSTPTYVKYADTVIVEIALKKPLALEGMHDVYVMPDPPDRRAIDIYGAGDRIGSPYVKCGWDKIKAIVLSESDDKTVPLAEISDEARRISEHILTFLRNEVKLGRLPKSLRPIQSGVGSVANAVLYGLCDSEFEDLTCYTEVIQDSMLELLRCGKAKVASATAISPSPEGQEKFFRDIELFKDRIIFRPQDISNSPEVVRRLGVLSMNTALEVDIYGNVNSTHVMGKRLMNGVGGSGDFSRNAGITIFTTASTAKGGTISSIVPMCAHVDHPEHDVMVVVTEQGYADLRGLSPKEKAVRIIENCAHPDYRDALMDYFRRACGDMPCQTPQLLEEALSWHSRFEKTGSMLP